MKRVDYRTVSLETVQGIKEAERLHRTGWKINRHGLFTVQFYKIGNKGITTCKYDEETTA